ncbi:MAG: neuraminidase-like domain-containing protein [Steroidobacteraceae bacterium]|jgi:hypothetical protein
MRNFSIQGVVRTPAGTAARDLEVIAYVQDLRVHRELGRAPTNRNGEYVILYQWEQPEGAEARGPDVVLKVASASGQLLYSSNIVFNASAQLAFEVNLQQEPTEAEFDRILRLVQPLAEAQHLPLPELEENDQHRDVTFLAGSSGIPRDRLTEFVIAQRLATDRLPAQFWFALLRTAVPQPLPPVSGWPSLQAAAQTTMSRALAVSPGGVETGLKQALARGVLGATPESSLSEWVKTFRDSVLALAGASGGVPDGAMTATAVGGTLDQATAPAARIGRILEIAAIPADKHGAVIEAFVDAGSGKDALNQLHSNRVLDTGQLQALYTHLGVDDIAHGDLGIVAAVKEFQIDPQRPDALRDIARAQASDWLGIIQRLGLQAPNFIDGDTPDQKRANYAEFVASLFHRRFPSAAFAAQLAKDQGGAGLNHAPELVRFLDNNPGFELTSTPIDQYLKDAEHPETAALAGNPDFVEALKASQRVLKISNPEAASTLLADGLHSAQQIHHMGKEGFVKTFAGKPGFTEATAADVFERATNTHAAAVAIVGELHAMGTANAVFVLNTGDSALDKFPDLAGLFGNLGSCECDQCSSVFSAAAYLADVLLYLKGRKLGGTDVKSILLARRPDIGDIQLTCENTNTTLPYVDLACEVLEERVAPWKVLQGAGLAAHLGAGAVDDTVRTAFSAGEPSIILTDKATIFAADASGAIVVRDGNSAWRIRLVGGAFQVSVLRQTTGTSDELSANPEYVNAAAYQKLSDQSYPLSLPFDLPTEEVRDYLAKVGVERSAVMEALRSDPATPSNSDISAEFFGIAPKEAEIIFVIDTANQFQYWGESTNDTAKANLVKLDTFLARSRLSYDELQTLLTLKFINSDTGISIVPVDASCDTSTKSIQPLDETILDRIHRFLRLWRKLGWRMWEVDLAIANGMLGNGQINDALLRNLYAFEQVRRKLGNLEVEKACALFDRINTRAKFTGLGGRPEPSLYEQLFLNKRAMPKPDLAFAVDTVTQADSPAPPPNVDAILPDHAGAAAAALRVNDADLKLLLNLKKPAAGQAAPTTYIDGKLSLSNLSFLYRHILLTKFLNIKAADWDKLLYLMQADVFSSPAILLSFLKLNERFKTLGYTVDELNYLLTADSTAKSAPPETSIASALTALRKSLQAISVPDPATVPVDTNGAISLTIAQLQALGWRTAIVDELAALLNREIRVATIPDAFAGFPEELGIPITYVAKTKSIKFRGIMTEAQRTTLLTHASLNAVTGLPNYQKAVNDIFASVHAAMKFYWPEFRVPLKVLPPLVDFSKLSPAALASKVSYDPEDRELVFFGVMTNDEQGTLTQLCAGDQDYVAAVGALCAATSGDLPGQHWVEPTDNNVSIVSAAGKLSAYVADSLRRVAAVQELSQAVGLAPAIGERLLTTAKLFDAHPVLDDFVDPVFVGSSSAVSSATFPKEFTGYRWLHRLALILGKSNPNIVEVDFVTDNAAKLGVVDLGALPLNPDPGKLGADAIGRLLDLTRLLELQHALSTANLALLDVFGRLLPDAGYSNAAFASDVSALTGWSAADVAALTAAAGGLAGAAYPADYRRVGAWEGLLQCFDLMTRINAPAAAAMSLADRHMTAASSQALKQLLRGKFEEAQWFDVSKSVQNSLRQRKRDSLVAYLLTQPAPDGVSTGKWNDATDLYSYFLIDVEMGACMQTSRIVQATNSAQLFLQRCFMGLEANVRISTDDDTSWQQWTWMKNYRVWEANRRVFVYPENYAEPELRRNKSELFKKLEDDLLQSDITKDSVDTAFRNYLGSLDEIAQLEVAGTYYQETNRTLHVFGRTPGREPHIYYYRQFISAQEPGRWTAWAKVECDIKSDYLVPVVANERLLLVWPEFREEPADQGQQTFPEKSAQGNSQPLPKTKKKMDVYLAVTELRSGKWLPKKLSQQPVSAGNPYETDFDQRPYVIVPLDLSAVSTGALKQGPLLLMVFKQDDTQKPKPQLFELAGCKGYPEPYSGTLEIVPTLTRFDNDAMLYMKNAELARKDVNPLTMTSNIIIGTNGFTGQILSTTPDLFKTVYPQYMSKQDRDKLENAAQAASYTVTLGGGYDWFYADKLRTFFVRYEPPIESQPPHFKFHAFYHPLTCFFIRQLNSPKGLDALMSRETQFQDNNLNFSGLYGPLSAVVPPSSYPKDDANFDPGECYSQYNWELFFFIPLMIALRLSSNQKFEDAMRWFHYIFDPTGGHDKDPTKKDPVTHEPGTALPPQKYWITKPFFLHTTEDYINQRTETLLNLLASHPGEVPGPPPATPFSELWNHVQEWRDNPFDPHIVAQYRTVAYQKLVVMKYLDNLIVWGDQQFRQFTMESVNAATQLYVLAAQILGPRPRTIRPAVTRAPETYNEIEPRLDAFSNALAKLENLVPPPPAGSGGGTIPTPIPTLPLLYFCIPGNDKLLGYWDTVADRLYKIRHCQDLDGVFHQLALFAPPIDPAMLIQALAGGASLADALAGLDAPLPNYRFSAMLRAANEFVGDLKVLGSALLSALEKKDAEALTLLRQQQELALLIATRAIKQAQIDGINQSLDGVQKSKEMVTIRRDYYASRPFINPTEAGALALNVASIIVHTAGTVADNLGGVVAAIPDFQLGASGFGGSPHVTVRTGGESLSKAAELPARALYNVAAIMDKNAMIAGVLAGYQRRMDDWQFQVSVANKELEQMDRQIAAMQVQLDNAQLELDNHDLQIANAKAIDAFFRDKYTNQALYQWTIAQISQTFWLSYRLAYDLAKRAERCFQYELGVENTSLIQFGYWDNLRSGLQAGERLQLALRQLESAYLDGNRRELECSKHISVAMLNPLALLKLKDSGTCLVDVPEELFDLDYPGHYFRRIKSVSLSLPCIAGPYTSVSCMLRLIKNMIRVTPSGSDSYAHNNDGGVLTDDVRFRESHVRVNAIAISNGQSDNGMFELNFHDERYLPFEGAGAISTWQIELMPDRSLRQFDYDTISDVVLHMHYTAREDAGQLKQSAIGHLRQVLSANSPGMPLRQLLDLRRDFATEWNAFLHPAGTDSQTLTIQLGSEYFGTLASGAAINITAWSLIVQSKSNDEMKVKIDPPFGADEVVLPIRTGGAVFRYAPKNVANAFDPRVAWSIKIFKTANPTKNLDPDELEECFLLIDYKLNFP